MAAGGRPGRGAYVIKLVLSDMDNTLVPLGGRVSPRTIEAIHAVIDAGVRFGPATGRDYVELARLFRMDEKCFQTGIFSNGKRVRVDGRYVSTTIIPHDQLVRIDQAIRGEKGMFLVCFPAETNLMNPAYGVGVSSAELAVFEARTVFNGGVVDEVPDIPFVAATIACTGGPERMERCRQIVAEAVPELRIVSPIPDWFDVMPQGMSKAAAFPQLLEELGITPDEVVFFGDAENDLELFREVGHPTAVANALPQVKALARHHVGASADEGVADALFEIAVGAMTGRTPDFMRE